MNLGEVSRGAGKWHLDEVVLGINSRHHYLWLAVDQNGNVLDIAMPSYIDKPAATEVLRQLLTDVTMPA